MTSAPLDLINGPLNQVRLVEASAGTGKTYAICLLYLRLLIKQSADVQKILVVSFTNAATAELRERIRTRLSGALHRLRNPGEPEADAPLRALLARYASEGRNSADLIQILELAIAGFDQSAIYTIHGFCKRVLDDDPFATGMPLALELQTDDAEVRHAVLADLYRQWLVQQPPNVAMATRLWDTNTLKKLGVELKRRLAKPLANLVWPTAAVTGTDISDADEQQFQAARTMWLQNRSAIFACLEASLPRFNASIFNLKSLTEGAAQWEQVFETESLAAVLSPTKKVSRLDRYATSKHKPKARQAPVDPHPFFDLASHLLEVLKTRDAGLQAAWMALIRYVVEEGPARVLQAKRTRRVLAFDDLLKLVYERLTGAAGGPLAAALRERYPIALVDEFQDTDPLQYGIFSAIYADVGTLFLVGDPKQAIYSFRNADLNVYFAASHQAQAIHTLNENQRSSAEYLRALNALFGDRPQAFLNPNLRYHALELGKKSRPPFVDHGAERGALHLWTLSSVGEDAVASLQQARAKAASATAAEIARLLADAENGKVHYDGRPLRAGDIAVIVPTRVRGREVRAQLARLQIGAVEISKNSVYQTDEAEEIDRILAAVLEPSRLGLVRAALATALLGLTATEIAGLASDETALVDHVERFVRYRDLWQRRGVGVMLRRVLLEYAVEQRVLTGPLGERRLTNLRHLIELLHTAAEQHPTADRLHRWLQTARADESADDAAQMRLESDRNLVQIVSIHAAKGLEYPIVFCPSLWDDFLGSDQDRGAAYEYYEEKNGFLIDYRDDAASVESAQNMRKKAKFEERLRLLYVALTRAVHRCYLVVGAYRRGTSLKPISKNALQWLVTRAESYEQHTKSQLTVMEVDAIWEALAGLNPEMLFAPLPLMTGVPVVTTDRLPGSIMAKVLPRPVQDPWRIGSYSGLMHGSGHEAAAVDRDTRLIAEPGPTPVAQIPDDDILLFPRGAKAGECIHAMFENADFTDALLWETVCAKALAQHPPGGAASAKSGTPIRQLQMLLRDVTETVLPPGFALQTVPLTRRLVEWEFSLPAHHLDAASLGALLDHYQVSVPMLHFTTLSGYLRGFVDLIIEHAGQYYVIDWKSNYLGDTAADYAPAGVAQAMATNGYHLQHLLYTVALHRFLHRRVPDYDYDRHLGGTLYLFVRGVRPLWPGAGVYFWRAPRSLIEALSSLLGGEMDAV